MTPNKLLAEAIDITWKVQEELMKTDITWVKLEVMRKAIEEVRYSLEHGYRYGRLIDKYGGLK